MNKLTIAKRIQITQLLVEGTSLRATSCIADVSINTVTKLLFDVGKACKDFHDTTVVGVVSQRVQYDEIWSFAYVKGKNAEKVVAAPDRTGDIWMWIGVDADTKLIVSWYLGNRDAESAYDFMQDMKSRVSNRIQLTTDGYRPYLKAVDETFGNDVDFAQLIKIYGSIEGVGDWYSQAKYEDIIKKPITGGPDEKYVSTSYEERHVRRFTRLTNTFSKKIENHCYAIALHCVYHNFIKVHKTLRVTPAMKAGLVDRPMNIQQIVELTN